MKEIATICTEASCLCLKLHTWPPVDNKPDFMIRMLTSPLPTRINRLSLNYSLVLIGADCIVSRQTIETHSLTLYRL